MRFHWYFPYFREDELAWAEHTPRTGESIVVQCIDRVLAPTQGQHGNVLVDRSLPDVDRRASNWTWMGSRAGTYVSRHRVRRALWRETEFDLVHLHYLNRFTDSILKLPTPLVLSVHDVRPQKPRLGPLEGLLLRRTYLRGDALIVHHATLREQLISEFPVDPARVHVLPHEVFPSPMAGPPTPLAGSPMLLFFGALRANKGLGRLVEALALRPHLDVRLTIAGRGESSVEEIATRAAEADDRITFESGTVSLERKRELFTAASLVVLPYTEFTSQSGVLHDAYSHGRPLVVTDVGALGDTVREERTGLVAQPDDAHDLVDKIESALNAQTWAALAKATVSVKNERSPQNTGHRLRAIYDTVL